VIAIAVEVSQLAAEKVHDRRKKFARWKAQPSYQIGFEADYDRVMDSGNIYLRKRGC
jgi:hypothetical protein